MERSAADLLAHLQHETEAFRRRFLLIICAVLGAAIPVVGVVYALSSGTWITFVVLGILTGLVSTAAALAWSWRHKVGSLLLFYGAVVSIWATTLLPEPGGRETLVDTSFFVFLGAIVCVGFLSGKRAVAAFTAVCVFLTLGALVLNLGDFQDQAMAISTSTTLIVLQVVVGVAMWSFTSRQESVLDALRQRLRETGSVIAAAREIARGDLTVEVAGDGEAASVVGEMLVALRLLVEDIQAVASQVNAAVAELRALADEQQRGASHQSAAITEAMGSLSSLVESSRRIADSAGVVRTNSEQALGTNEKATQVIQAFAAHTNQINDLLTTIKEVANKTELLALNAILEGIRAGEAGTGFSLVAAEMQSLSERVMEAASDVQRLTLDFDSYSQDAVRSIRRATDMASATTDVAREIHLFTQGQSEGTTQLDAAMRDIGAVTRGVNQSAGALGQAAEHLEVLTGQLEATIARFEIVQRS